MDSRLPPDLDPDRAFERVRGHLDRHGFAGLAEIEKAYVDLLYALGN